MTFLLLASFSGMLLGWLMGFLSLFLILLILIQRGKGGGLTGALGGPGGQSAFGSKAGDTFTVITIVVASIWGFTCAFTMWLLGTHAPTKVTETTITAGPGDKDRDTSGELIIPPMGGTPSPSIPSPGTLSPDGAETETPSVELTPASPPASSNAESNAPKSNDTRSDSLETEDSSDE